MVCKPDTIALQLFRILYFYSALKMFPFEINIFYRKCQDRSEIDSDQPAQNHTDSFYHCFWDHGPGWHTYSHRLN